MNKSPEKIESLYVHFPFCRHLCNYCDFYKHKTDGDYSLSHFHDYLEKTESLHSELLTKENRYIGELKTLYIGGGTPSLWGLEGPEKLKKYKLKIDCEATLEVNPGSWDRASLKAWTNFGINRFSLGVQSTNDFYLKALDRVHSRQEVFETLNFFKGNYSVDFMLGLPFSEKEGRDILAELEEILNYGPGHISLYILTVGENYPHFKDLPSEDFIHQEYMSVAKYLKNRGFDHYEVSNFALPGRQSAHNLNYWKCSSVAALGPSATGFINGKDRGFRYKWVGQDARFTQEELGVKELRLEKIYMGLRSSIGLNLYEYLDPESSESLLLNWQSLGYISEHINGFIRLSSKGFLMLDSLMNDLFIKEENL